MQKEDVSRYVNVFVNIINTDRYQDPKKVGARKLKLKVDINDKLSKLKKYTTFGSNSGPVGGLISYNGKLIENPDKTYKDLMIKNN